MRLIRELRLIPVVLFAAVCLLALKILGFLAEDRPPATEIDLRPEPFARREVAAAGDPERGTGQAGAREKSSWATEMFNFPDVTGSFAGKKPAEKNTARNPTKPVKKDPEQPGDTPTDAQSPYNGGGWVPLLQAPQVPPGERALLQRLQQRRQELDARSRELEIRENLLKAAEQQFEIRMGELKQLEARVQNASQKKGENQTLHFKRLVTMYENMRAKDAAKIFDRLELRVLLEVASKINPRRMADILAQMQPASAERLTIELANRANAVVLPPKPKQLPKITGRPRPP